MAQDKVFRVTFNGYRVVRQSAPDRGRAALRAWQHDHDESCYAVATSAATFEIRADGDDRLLSIAAVSCSKSDNPPAPWRDPLRTPYHGIESL